MTAAERNASAAADAGPALSGQCRTSSRLERVLREGHFAVTCEIGPPQSARSEGITKHASILKDYSDGQNLTDNQTAIVRLSSLAAAVHVKAAGGEPIMQMVARDRNRIAIQSDVLGAASLGIRNLLCLAGDHQSFGNHPEARNVHDVDSLQMMQIVRAMRDERKFQCGEEIKSDEPRMFVGCAANPFGDPFEFRVRRLAKKIAAGAEFIQTQCIFDMDRFEKWMRMVRDEGLDEKVFILGGITPVKSDKALKYIKTVPGMKVPDELIRRMEGAADKKAEGVNVAVEMIQRLKEIRGVRGVHIMAIAWESIVPEIVEKAGLYPRPKVAEVEEAREKEVAAAQG
jgi:methylenetetrahydrofolate reductase (NADPH)